MTIIPEGINGLNNWTQLLSSSLPSFSFHFHWKERNQLTEGIFHSKNLTGKICEAQVTRSTVETLKHNETYWVQIFSLILLRNISLLISVLLISKKKRLTHTLMNIFQKQFLCSLVSQSPVRFGQGKVWETRHGVGFYWVMPAPRLWWHHLCLSSL